MLAVWLRPLVDYLDASGFDSREIFQCTGVDIDRVFIPGTRLPLSQAAPLWKKAAEAMGNPFIGLDVVPYAPPLQADTMAIAMMASRNFYEALQIMARLSPLVCDAVEIKLLRDGNHLRVIFLVHPQDRHIMPNEAMIPALLPIRWFFDGGLVDKKCIEQICFCQEYPGEKLVEHLQSYFSEHIKFGCELDTITFDWHSIQKQNPYWNPSLAKCSEEIALSELQKLNESNLIQVVKRYIAERLVYGEPQQEELACSLNISSRQLQRRLKAQGTRFKILLEQVRLDLAYRYLKDSNMTMVDIALSLGFNDQSNFIKAFKRWQGETPGQFRRKWID